LYLHDRLKSLVMSTNISYPNPPRPSRSLDGRVAIVTGAGSQASGIGNGRASAILLAEAGAKVVCSDINFELAEATVAMINVEFGAGKAIAIKADVTKAEECKSSVDLALSTYGRLDILVNNVGIGGALGSAVETDMEQWARGMDINVTSMVLMTKYAVPAMEKNEVHPIYGRGAIVNVGSICGLIGGTPGLLYSTSKGAIVNMTRTMAAHHALMGIRVNSVCPGLLFTPMLYGAGMPTHTRETRRKASLLQTEGNAWDCGAAVRFLASEEARWITGINMPVDAGTTASLLTGNEIFATLR